jgi:hypothetical protein
MRRAILLCLAIAAFALIYPVYVIRPFRHQAPGELALAMQIMRYRPIMESVCALVAIFCAVRRRSLLTIAGAVSVVGCALLSRIHIYEQMFHPDEQPAFAAASESKLAPKEQVIAISVAGAARAYPVRIISYHHIINDTLAGEPVVATY